MKVLSVTAKTLRELWREPLLLGLMFAFPILLVAFYYIAFGNMDQGLASYLTIYIVNDDRGTRAADGSHWNAGELLTEAIQGEEWEGQPVFEVHMAGDRRGPQLALREQKAALLLIVPPDFSQALQAAGQGQVGRSPAVVTLAGYPTSDNYVFAENYLDDMVHQFARRVLDEPSSVTVNYEFIPGTGTMSDFDFGVPGLIVFGVMFLAVTTAETLVRENVSGTLKRLQLSGMRAADLLVGVTLAQLVIAMAVMPATLGVAVALGFQVQGSLILAAGTGLLLAFTAIGLGLVTACFARNDGEAANLSAAALVIMVLLSGALYPMPNAPIATVAGRGIQAYDLFPTTHASEAMRQILVFGAGLSDIAYRLVAMAVLSLAFLAVGIGLYGRLKLTSHS